MIFLITFYSTIRLLCDSSNRLKSSEVRSHSFFNGIDWGNLRHQRAPFIPQLTSITDTSYFPTEELSNVPEHLYASEDPSGDVIMDNSMFSSLAFLGICDFGD